MSRTFLLAIIVATFTSPTHAQSSSTLVCQYVDAGGLVWDSGRWRASAFTLPQPFALAVMDGVLTPESVARAFSSSFSFECVTDHSRLLETCTGPIGPALFFNHMINQGVVANIFQAGQMSSRQDSLIVSSFVCQRM